MKNFFRNSFFKRENPGESPVTYALGLVLLTLVLMLINFSGFSFESDALFFFGWNLLPVIVSLCALLATGAIPFLSSWLGIGFCAGSCGYISLIHLAWIFDYGGMATSSSTAALIFIYIPVQALMAGIAGTILGLAIAILLPEEFFSTPMISVIVFILLTLILAFGTFGYQIWLNNEQSAEEGLKPEEAKAVTCVDWVYLIPESWTNQPLHIVNENIIVNGSNGRIYGLDYRSGEKKWEFKYSPKPTWNAFLTAGKEKVYVVSRSKKKIYAISGVTGDSLWNRKLKLISKPLLLGDQIFVGNEVLNINTGETIRKLRQPLQKSFTKPVHKNGKIFLGGGLRDTHIYARDSKTGVTIWEFATYGGVLTKPLVYRDKVYAGSRDNYLYALKPDSGELIWKFKTKDWIQKSPAGGGGRIFVGSQDNHLYALDADSGKQLWKFKVDSGEGGAPAATYVNNRLFVAEGLWGDRVFELEPATGEVKKSINIGKSVRIRPRFKDRRLYFTSIAGYVYCCNLSSGE